MGHGSILLLGGGSRDGRRKFILRAFCQRSRPPEGKKNSSPQQAMLEMNVHFVSLCSKSFIVISHAHKHTHTHTQSVLSVLYCYHKHTKHLQYVYHRVYSFTPMMFSYIILFIFTRRSNGFYEYEDCFFSKKNL